MRKSISLIFMEADKLQDDAAANRVRQRLAGIVSPNVRSWMNPHLKVSGTGAFVVMIVDVPSEAEADRQAHDAVAVIEEAAGARYEHIEINDAP